MIDQNDPKLIQISISTIAKMVKFDLSNPGKETAGLLIGHEENGIVYVDDVRLGNQKGNAVHVEVSEEELTMAAIEISKRSDNKVIVGWIHTHPNLSAFLSPTDIRTQSHYQALMPNAIAVVLDGAKYSKTKNIDDLDLRAFRVENGKAKEFRYLITNSVEFALNSFVFGEVELKVHKSKLPEVYTIPVPSKKQISKIRILLDQTSSDLHENDVASLKVWLELLEAIESGTTKEVPIDVERLIYHLNNSIDVLNESLDERNYNLEYKRAEKTLLLTLFGVFIIFAFFFFLFGNVNVF